MGDRISIQFKNGRDISVTLFSHWRGKSFLSEVNEYFKQLKPQISGMSYPIDRLEPETVMVDFIRYITKNEEIIKSDLYLGVDGNDGDNSDNGNWVFDLEKGDWIY